MCDQLLTNWRLSAGDFSTSVQPWGCLLWFSCQRWEPSWLPNFSMVWGKQLPGTIKVAGGDYGLLVVVQSWLLLWVDILREGGSLRRVCTLHKSYHHGWPKLRWGWLYCQLWKWGSLVWVSYRGELDFHLLQRQLWRPSGDIHVPIYCLELQRVDQDSQCLSSSWGQLCMRYISPSSIRLPSQWRPILSYEKWNKDADCWRNRYEGYQPYLWKLDPSRASLGMHQLRGTWVGAQSDWSKLWKCCLVHIQWKLCLLKLVSQIQS